MAKVIKVFEDVITRRHRFQREDNGASYIAELGNVCDPIDASESSPELFIRIHSWDTSKNHTEFKELLDKKVRVIIETLDENDNKQT
jgi:uncharacterized protein (DUF1501 family)